ncbi:MAG: rod shape-determining protein MreD [Dehalococcoidia bacterium]|nr:rod shape-determining protein MreD [Dehalococcoidia bacterium]
MAFPVSVFLVLAASLFQAAFPPAGPVAGIKPDLVLVLAVMASMLLGLRYGLVLSVLGGIILDLFSGMTFGFVTLSLLLVTSLARFPNPDLLEINPLVCMLVIALDSFFYYGIYSLGMLALGGELDWFRLFTRVVLPSVVMNTLVSPLVYGLMILLGRRKMPVREDWR